MKTSLHKSNQTYIGKRTFFLSLGILLAAFLLSFGSLADASPVPLTNTAQQSIEDEAAAEIQITNQLLKAGSSHEAIKRLERILALLKQAKIRTRILLNILGNLEIGYQKLGDEENLSRIKSEKLDLLKELESKPDFAFHGSEENKSNFSNRAISNRASLPYLEKGAASFRSIPHRQTRLTSEQERHAIREHAPQQIIANIYRMIFLSEDERDLWRHPTVGTKEVIDHYETRRGYREDGSSYSYEVAIMKTVEYTVTTRKDIESFVHIDQLGEEFGMSAHSIGDLNTSVESGGAVLFFDNGFIVGVPTVEKWTQWKGSQVAISEDSSGLPYIVIHNKDLNTVTRGKVVFIRK